MVLPITDEVFTKWLKSALDTAKVGGNVKGHSQRLQTLSEGKVSNVQNSAAAVDLIVKSIRDARGLQKHSLPPSI